MVDKNRGNDESIGKGGNICHEETNDSWEKSFVRPVEDAKSRSMRRSSADSKASKCRKSGCGKMR